MGPELGNDIFGGVWTWNDVRCKWVACKESARRTRQERNRRPKSQMQSRPASNLHSGRTRDVSSSLSATQELLVHAMGGVPEHPHVLGTGLSRTPTDAFPPTRGLWCPWWSGC